MLCCRVVKEETGNAEWLWLDESTELTRGDVRHHPSSSTSLRNRLCCPVAMGEVRGDAGGHPRRHYVDTCATRSAYEKLAWMACWREPGGFTLSWGVSCGALTSARHEAHAWDALWVTVATAVDLLETARATWYVTQRVTGALY